ncbi:MAG: hypothetical protein GTO02_17900, partial [Candidatus Dadabacteria bacterium]|nr:hypothetical protein [Candidatus Dadabacteria bacterium]NIQ16190.1 hypothetical protein [Candidatus Dadabacteria bacterium]
SLESNDNPNTFEVVDIDNNKNELSIFYKTEKFKEIRKKSGNPYAVVKIKPFNSKDKNINLIDTDKSKPLLSNLSLGRAPKYDNSLIKQSDKLYIDYLPLDKGNSWSYKVENNGTLESTTVNIISIYEGWSLVDDFFGKKNIGFKIDADGEF